MAVLRCRGTGERVSSRTDRGTNQHDGLHLAKNDTDEPCNVVRLLASGRLCTQLMDISTILALCVVSVCVATVLAFLYGNKSSLYQANQLYRG